MKINKTDAKKAKCVRCQNQCFGMCFIGDKVVCSECFSKELDKRMQDMRVTSPKGEDK